MRKKNETVYYRGIGEDGTEYRGAPYFYGNKTYILSVNDSFYGIVEVKRETLSSYTGKTDKYGNYIFEGDVVRYEYDPKKYGDPGFEDYLVQWDAEQAGFCISTDLNPYEDGLSGMQHFEVIGNVFENSVLANRFKNVMRTKRKSGV